MGLPKRKQFKWSLSSKQIQIHTKVRKKDEFVWESSNGKQFYIEQMDINHIKNAIAKIERGEYDWSRERFLKLFKIELIYREIINKQKLIDSDEKSRSQSGYAVSV